jgi:hypothetical protein
MEQSYCYLSRSTTVRVVKNFINPVAKQKTGRNSNKLSTCFRFLWDKVPVAHKMELAVNSYGLNHP